MADGTITSVEELKQYVGKETRVGDWHTVTQAEIDAFADATGDHQWIHVDPERAKAGPFGGTSAHRVWTLSAAPFIMRGRYFVEALGRGLALLDCFIADPGPLSLIELSRRVGLGMPTTLRLIRTLQEAGYVRQAADTKRYRLSWKMLQLQDVTTSILDYADLARPHLENLAAIVGESTGMAVLDGTDVRNAIRVSSNR